MIGRVDDEGPKQTSALLVAHALAGFAGPCPSKQPVKEDHCRDFSRPLSHDLDPVSITSSFVSSTNLVHLGRIRGFQPWLLKALQQLLQLHFGCRLACKRVPCSYFF
jgi:hypothetical protein